jgi:hypothetical protein
MIYALIPKQEQEATIVCRDYLKKYSGFINFNLFFFNIKKKKLFVVKKCFCVKDHSPHL